MRYFVELAYKGTHYHGWQMQPNASSVQAAIEEAFSTLLQEPIAVVGCARTDAGVHACQYFLHFDTNQKIPTNFLSRINKYLGVDIAFRQIFQVSDETHARFDASKRSYEYHMHFQKDPFLTSQSFYFPYALDKINMDRLQDAAKLLLLNYNAFAPFCKTRSDVKTMNCQLHRSEWQWLEPQKKLVYHISADRFLRGMVRLIVGMCLNVSMNKLSLNEVKKALENQERMKKNYSVPAEGLFLTEVKYGEVLDH